MIASARSSLEQLTNSRPQFPQGLQVLLVEPCRDQHTLQQLQELQYVVNCAKDIPAAVAALTTSSSIDVIMADVSLVGDLAGDDASRLFSTAGQVPVVLIGSHCSPSQVLAAVEHGAADVLEKPLSQLKLRNIWQHTVRAAMVGTGETCPAPQEPNAAAVDDLMAKHDAAADAAAAAAATLASSSATEGLLQEQHQLSHPLLHSKSYQAIDDCYTDLGLPTFLPPQADPESLFLDLEAPVQPGEPGLDAIMQTCTPSSSAAADEYSTEQVLTVAMCSSEHHGSGATGMTALTGELESSADTSTRRSGGMHSSAGLRSRGNLGDSAGLCDLQHSAIQSAAPVAVTASVTCHQQQQMLVPGCPVHPPMHLGPWGPHWGGRGVPYGMVWGMPVYTVARAPGFPVPAANKAGNSTSASGSAGINCSRERYHSCTGSAAASASSSPTHKNSCTTATATAAAGQVPFLPSVVPPMPMMPPQAMQSYAPFSSSAVATGMQPAASQMPPYPGMLPAMYPGMVQPTMWPMCMYSPYMGMPCMGSPGMPGVGFTGMPGVPTMPGWSPMGMGACLSWGLSGVQRQPVLTAPGAACPTTAAVAGAVAGGFLYHETITSTRAIAVKQNAAVAGGHSIGNSFEASMPVVAAVVTAYDVDFSDDSKLSGGSDAFVDGLFVDDCRLSPQGEDFIC